MVVTGHLFTILIHGGFIMYEKYLLQLEEAGKIRNLKERSINCYKNYVSYFLNYMGKIPEELTCQRLSSCQERRWSESNHPQPL